MKGPTYIKPSAWGRTYVVKYTGEIKPSKFCPTHKAEQGKPATHSIVSFPGSIRFGLFFMVLLTSFIIAFAIIGNAHLRTPSHDTPSNPVSEEWLHDRWSEYEKEVK